MKILIVIIIVGIILSSGCITSRQMDTVALESLNSRMANIEKVLETKPPQIRELIISKPETLKNLNEAQKDFTKWMLEYLAGRK
jgi:hypothetical protein